MSSLAHDITAAIRTEAPFIDDALLDYLGSLLANEEDREDFVSAFEEVLGSYPSIPAAEHPHIVERIAARVSALGIELASIQPRADPTKAPLQRLAQPIKIQDQPEKGVTVPTSELWEPKIKVERINLDHLEAEDAEGVERGIAEILNLAFEDADEEEGDVGGCLMCHRDAPLTRHHVIPRTVHGDKKFKKLYTKEEMNQVIMICRPCHSAIHSYIDEKTMALRYNTLEKLLEHEKVQKWLPYISKQKVRIRAPN